MEPMIKGNVNKAIYKMRVTSMSMNRRIVNLFNNLVNKVLMLPGFY